MTRLSDKIFRWPVTRLRHSLSILSIGNSIALLALCLAAIQFLLDSVNRVDERIARAWQIVATQAPGNSGKKEALEYLNRRDGLLCWGSSSRTCIFAFKLRTELTGIDLSEIRHHGTVILDNVNLSGAVLKNANLSGVSLIEANLSGSDLLSTNLSGTLLFGANLSGTNLSRAQGLEQAQLDLACANIGDPPKVTKPLSWTRKSCYLPSN